MKGDIYHEKLADGRIRTSTIPESLKMGVTTTQPKTATPNSYWVTNADGTKRLVNFLHTSKKIDPNDQILREILEEVITKSHRQWRSIPETTFLVLKAVEDYQNGN